MNEHPSLHQRFLAYLMSNSGKEYNAMLGRRKRALLGDLHGDVLEIGPGSAPNLEFYASDVHWHGVEPNPAMLVYAQREAQRLGLTLDWRQGEAERLPVADNSMDAVVSTTVLCSVRDPQQVLREILRVLKPGGQFVFIEHVAAPANTRQRRRQGFLRPLWRKASDGCHLDRETWVMIEQAGFSRVQLDHFRLNVPLVSPHIAGVAIK
jgi:ubiquinone/menaquinone biosynthesis C-methylase UbiE